MILTNGDVLTIGNAKYLIVETARYDDVDYLFTNKLSENEDLSENYFVMKKTENGVIIVNEQKLLDILLPIFTKKIQKDAEDYNEQSKFEI